MVFARSFLILASYNFTLSKAFLSRSREKIAFVSSVLALVILCFIPKEHSRPKKFSAKSDNSKVVSNLKKSEEKMLIEIGLGVSVFKTTEEYLSEALEIRSL